MTLFKQQMENTGPVTHVCVCAQRHLHTHFTSTCLHDVLQAQLGFQNCRGKIPCVFFFQVPQLSGKILTLCCIAWPWSGRRGHFPEDIVGSGLQALWTLLCRVSCMLPTMSQRYLDEHSRGSFCPLILGSTWLLSLFWLQFPSSYDRSHSTASPDHSLTTANQLLPSFFPFLHSLLSEEGVEKGLTVNIVASIQQCIYCFWVTSGLILLLSMQSQFFQTQIFFSFLFPREVCWRAIYPLMGT